ncbi:MAG: hypothetical protein ACFE8A_13990 [Candidatus Hodarchaeota archaeon]
MKCKLFTSKELQKLEERINIWLEENPEIQIIHVGQSTQFLTENYPSHTIISVFYEKEGKKPLEKDSYI